MAKAETTLSGTELLFNFGFLHEQLFWTATAFVLLLVMMAIKVVPALTKILDERAGKIAHDLNTAEDKRVAAEKILADYEAKLSAAKDEAAQIITKARTEAKNLVDNRLAELEAELTRKRDETKQAIEATRAQAMQDLQTDAAKLVVQVTEKLISTKVTEQEAEKLTAAAVKNLH